MFRKLKPLFEEIYFSRKTDAIGRYQNLFAHEIERLDHYGPRVEPNVSNRRKILENANHFGAFRNRLFPMSDGNYYRGPAAESEDSSEDDDDGNNANNGNNSHSGGSSDSNDLDGPPRNGEPSGSNINKSQTIYSKS